MESKPEILPEGKATHEECTEEPLQSRKPYQIRAKNVLAQQSRLIARLLRILEGVIVREDLIRSFYTKEVAILNQVYCIEMAQHISRLDHSYEVGHYTQKRKTALGEIILNSCFLLMDINKEMYEEAIKPYRNKYRKIEQGISLKQQHRENIPIVAKTLEIIYNTTLTKEAHMAKDVESFLQTAHKKISIQLNEEEKERLATYTNNKMSLHDWKRECNQHEAIGVIKAIQKDISTQLFRKKSEARKREEIEEQFKEALHTYQETNRSALLKMQLRWIQESETQKTQLSEEKLATYNKCVGNLSQKIKNELTRIITTPLAGLPSEYELLLKIPERKLPNKLEHLKANAKKRLKNSLYLSECIRSQVGMNQYIDTLIKEMRLDINPEYRTEKERF